MTWQLGATVILTNYIRDNAKSQEKHTRLSPSITLAYYVPPPIIPLYVSHTINTGTHVHVLNIVILVLLRDQHLGASWHQFVRFHHTQGLIVNREVHLQFTLLNVVIPGHKRRQSVVVYLALLRTQLYSKSCD